MNLGQTRENAACFFVLFLSSFFFLSVHMFKNVYVLETKITLFLVSFTLSEPYWLLTQSTL